MSMASWVWVLTLAQAVRFYVHFFDTTHNFIPMSMASWVWVLTLAQAVHFYIHFFDTTLLYPHVNGILGLGINFSSGGSFLCSLL